MIEEIDAVALPAAGSNKFKVVRMATMTAGQTENIRFVVDRDLDDDMAHPELECLWVTDHRDAESYLLRSDCFAKVLDLGLSTEGPSPEALLASVMEAGRWLSALRVVCARGTPKLGVSEIKLSKYFDATAERVEIEKTALVQTILQRAGASLKLRDDLITTVEAEVERSRHIPDLAVVHGKDGVALACAIFSNFGAKDPEAMLRCAFEATMTTDYETLRAIVDYLIAA